MPTDQLKIIFAGTPAFGVPVLQALSERHQLLSIYTQPDRPMGRGQHLQYTPVKEWALAHQVPVYQPENFKSPEVREALSAQQPDLMVVVAYGLILPSAVLQIPRLGCVNVHASRLPAHRGASPIQSAILNGDSDSAVTIMQMDAGMDTGPILAMVPVPILPTDTAAHLHDRLSVAGVPALLEVIDALRLGRANPVPQPSDGISYAKKIQKEDAHVNWGLPAICIERQIRAYQPWPVAFTFYETLRIRLLEASVEACAHTAKPGEILAIEPQGLLVATADGALRIRTLQFAGGKVLSVAQWCQARSPLLVVGGMLT